MTKEKSKQATQDEASAAILQNPASTSREKEKAFNDLYSQHEKQVLFYFNKNLRSKKRDNEENAEDLRSVTFQKVFENIESFNPKTGAFSTWLYTIATNTLIDFKRREKFEELSLDELTTRTNKDGESGYLEFQLKGNGKSPEQQIISEEKMVELMGAINSIENKIIRELAIERFVNELDYEEIAKKMGVPDNSTLRVRVLRARDILQAKVTR